MKPRPSPRAHHAPCPPPPLPPSHLHIRFMYHGPACGLHWPGSRGARPPPQPRPASARRCAGPCRLQPCGSSSPPRGAWVLEPAESATTSAWRRGRTAAPPQWALNGSVARPECVTQPGAPSASCNAQKAGRVGGRAVLADSRRSDGRCWRPVHRWRAARRLPRFGATIQPESGKKIL